MTQPAMQASGLAPCPPQESYTVHRLILGDPGWSGHVPAVTPILAIGRLSLDFITYLGEIALLVKEVFHIVVQLNRRGVTILLVEQNAAAALKIAGYAYVLETGRVVLAGTGAELLEHPHLKDAYLGDGAEGL